MGRFFYFFPAVDSADALTPELLAECGLDRVLELHGAEIVRGSKGPGGATGGVLVTATGPVSTPAYDEASQMWHSCADGKFWLGYTTAERPGPADLVRDDAADGYGVALGDGNRWRIPAAIVHGDTKLTTALPQSFGIGPNGTPAMVHLAKHATIVEYAATALAGFKSLPPFGESADVLVADDFKHCACLEALATNYRVGRWEVAALGLLGPDYYDVILSALVDLPGLLRQHEEAAAVEAVEATP